MAPGRSTIMLETGRRCNLIKSTISLRTQLCQWLYSLISRATGHLFRTRMSIYFPPHGLQPLLRHFFCRHSVKLELWGRVSDAALRANLRLSDGKLFTASDQISDAPTSVIVMSCPCRGRLSVCSHLLVASFSLTLDLLLFTSALLLIPGSSAITSRVNSMG